VAPDVGLGVNAVRATGPQRVPVGERVLAQCRGERGGPGDEQVGRLRQLERERGVEQVLCASLQTRPISGSVYRSITWSLCRSPGPR
jgi:hypothetical protein